MDTQGLLYKAVYTNPLNLAYLVASDACAYVYGATIYYGSKTMPYPGVLPHMVTLAHSVHSIDQHETCKWVLYSKWTVNTAVTIV